jgi:hypothetical protein
VTLDSQLSFAMKSKISKRAFIDLRKLLLVYSHDSIECSIITKMAIECEFI